MATVKPLSAPENTSLALLETRLRLILQDPAKTWTDVSQLLGDSDPPTEIAAAGKNQPIVYCLSTPVNIFSVGKREDTVLAAIVGKARAVAFDQWTSAHKTQLWGIPFFVISNIVLVLVTYGIIDPAMSWFTVTGLWQVAYMGIWMDRNVLRFVVTSFDAIVPMLALLCACALLCVMARFDSRCVAYFFLFCAGMLIPLDDAAGHNNNPVRVEKFMLSEGASLWQRLGVKALVVVTTFLGISCIGAILLGVKFAFVDLENDELEAPGGFTHVTTASLFCSSASIYVVLIAKNLYMAIKHPGYFVLNRVPISRMLTSQSNAMEHRSSFVAFHKSGTSYEV